MPRVSLRQLVLIAAGSAVTAACTTPNAPTAPAPRSPPEGSLAELNADVFDQVWVVVRDTHPDPSINLGAWNDARLQFRQRAIASRDDIQLRGVLEDMLETLGESHFAIIPNSVSGTAEANGGWSGMTVQVIDGQGIVTQVDARGPAAAAGIKTGWRITKSEGDSVDVILKPFGEPRTSLERLSRERALSGFIGGRPGMSPTYTLVDAEGAEHTVQVTFDDPPGEAVSFGNLPPFPAEAESRWLSPPEISALGGDPSKCGRIGYLRFSIWMPALSTRIDDALFEFRSSDAVVIDLRGNPGGLGLMATGVAGHFLADPVSLGTMHSRESTINFKTNPRTVDRTGRAVGTFAGPLALLIDPHTGSTSEIFAAGLVDAKRAECFGRTSAGAALPATTHGLKNGDVLLHAIGDFKTPSGLNIEGTGVSQSTGNAPTRADYTASSDPELRDAIAWIQSHPRTIR